MKSRSASEPIRLPFVYAVLVHVVIFGLFVFSFGRAASFSVPPPAMAIQATVVDDALIEKELARLEAHDRQKRDNEVQRQRDADAQVEAARLEAQREQERLHAIKAKAEEAQQQAARQEAEALQRRDAEQLQARKRQEQAAADEKRLADIAAKAEAEQKRLKELAAKAAVEEAAAKKAADEKARLEREAAEAKRKRDDAAKAAARAKQREAEELMRLAMIEEEEHQAAVSSGLLDQYATLIRQKVERNWIRPPGAGKGLECEVRVRQIPGGEVVDVSMGKCNGDATVIRSIEAAVYKASPLPAPPDPSLFEKRLIFRFAPKE